MKDDTKRHRQQAKEDLVQVDAHTCAGIDVHPCVAAMIVHSNIKRPLSLFPKYFS